MEQEGVEYRGVVISELNDIARLYSRLTNRNDLPRPYRWVYRFFGSRLLLVACQASVDGPKIVGMNMFYLNARDIKEFTIHEGFIGVDENFRGQGISTNLRRHAVRHFRDQGFLGISSRVDVDNIPSLKSALKTGFRPVEQYRDETTGVERYYLVNNFGIER